MKIKLKKTEIEQLSFYVEVVEKLGEYYGNKKQFDNRHKKIKEFLANLLK